MIETICICGAGTMGSGIAQVAAQSGFKTIQFDVDVAMVEKSKVALHKNFQSLVDKGRLTEEEKTASIGRTQFTNNINECKADVIIEAIIEKKEAKVHLFKQLAEINNNETILATNTSSLSINSIAEELRNSERVVGMHFFNPAPLMKLVEVVKGEQTTNQVVELICELTRQLGKTPVVCKDVPGFIVNRVARPYYLEAMKLIEAGVVDFETIDRIMEATGFKMGPFKLMDLIGMDINYSVSNIVWEALGKPSRLTPSSIQRQKVDAGELGKKTSKGFYSY
ncbi:MAG TPA: 3-hydroxyacyl-CoA dehydrogenase NAD-binding domain-containing protein [Segetibacter sp.]